MERQDAEARDPQARPTVRPLAQFRTAVSRVRVDVIVTDDDGAFVADLGPEDFEIREDGEPQRVIGATLIDFDDGRVFHLAEGATAADEMARESGDPTAPAGTGADETAPEPTEGTLEAAGELLEELRQRAG